MLIFKTSFSLSLLNRPVPSNARRRPHGYLTAIRSPSAKWSGQANTRSRRLKKDSLTGCVSRPCVVTAVRPTALCRLPLVARAMGSPSPRILGLPFLRHRAPISPPMSPFGSPPLPLSTSTFHPERFI